jgi:hypothetical protein
MAIYVDDPMPVGGKFHNYSHMWTDEDTKVLVEFAVRLGLNRTWLQNSRGASGDFYHFDISPRYREKALKAGAVYMNLMDWTAARIAERRNAP